MGTEKPDVKVTTLDQLRNSKEQILSEFCETVRGGGIIIFPTETSYLLGADGLNGEAVNRIYELKHRPIQFPVTMAFSSVSEAQQYCVWDERAMRLADLFLPGPLTLVLPLRSLQRRLFGVEPDNVGIRIPGYKPLLEFLRVLNRPLTATSANPHGGPEPFRIDQCVSGVDRIIDAGELPVRKSSTIVSLCGFEPVILREGSIQRSEINQALR